MTDQQNLFDTNIQVNVKGDPATVAERVSAAVGVSTCPTCHQVPMLCAEAAYCEWACARRAVPVQRRPDPVADPPRTPPYQAHSATSREAAVSMLPRTGTLRREVYDWLLENGPATDEQIIAGTGLSPSTARPRRIELVEARLAVADGEALTIAGRRAVLWRALPLEAQR